MNYIGISKDQINKLSIDLNILLATYSVYYQNLRSFHWHVKGNNFFELHRFFESLYNEAKVNIDKIAERIITLDEKPFGSLTEYLKFTKIQESKDILDDEAMIRQTLENHKVIIGLLRKAINQAQDINDEGSADMLCSMLGTIEKNSWMINAWSVKQYAISQN